MQKIKGHHNSRKKFLLDAEVDALAWYKMADGHETGSLVSFYPVVVSHLFILFAAGRWMRNDRVKNTFSTQRHT